MASSTRLLGRPPHKMEGVVDLQVERDQIVRGPETKMTVMVNSFLMAKQQLSEKSAREYAYYLADYAKWCDDLPIIQALETDRVNAYVRLRKSKALYAARGACAILKSFASWLAEEGHLRSSSGGSVLANVKTPKVPKEGRPALEDSELAKIRRVIETGPNGKRQRDAALFWLLLCTGVRANEARELRLRDVQIEPRGPSHVDVRWRTSKGLESRRVRLDPLAAAAIHTYIEDWRPTSQDEHLFLTEAGKCFKPGGFQAWCARLRDQFEREGVRDWKAHRMRHTWATQYHRVSRESGATLYDLQREGGWKDQNTPRRYTKDRPWEELASLKTAATIIFARMRVAG